MKNLVKYATIAAAFAPLLTYGQSSAPGQLTGGTGSSITTLQGVWDVIQSIMNWIVAIFFLYATFQFLRAGWKYLSSQGDAKAVEEVRQQLIYGVVGVMVGLLAFSIPAIVKNFLHVQ